MDVYQPAGAALPSVLVMSHSHPNETRGGAEIAALTLFRALKNRSARTWLVGCAGPRSEARLGAAFSQPYGADDYVYHPAAGFDYFKFANPDPNFPKAIGELVGDLRPDIVHTHHFARFGVEAFSIIKRNSPQTKIVLSLHEFLAICNHHGQMVKTAGMRLCDRESYSACASCFPEFSPRDFFLRKRYIQTFFEDVDLFISPSHFLAERFRAWGLPEAKLAVLENMPPVRDSHIPETQTPRAPAVPSPQATTSRRGASAAAPQKNLRFGFFGQMSPLKGIKVLAEAGRLLAKMEVQGAVIEIFGDYSNQPAPFQIEVETALAEAGESIIYHGPYDNKDVNRLMRRMDAVIVPSIWWENSPVVIQEAFTNERPVICSNIGGMAEKVIDGVTGFHFDVGRAASLAELIAGFVRDPERLAALRVATARPSTADAALDAHLRLYRSLMKEKDELGNTPDMTATRPRKSRLTTTR